MKRLSVLVRLVSAILLVLPARALIGGLTVGIDVVAAALVAALLVFATALVPQRGRLQDAANAA
jgi:hypothetical protein